MALATNKENVMSAIASLGYKVFRGGQFHWESKATPDMQINEDGTIHCWTSSPFGNKKGNHGDLVDFLMITDSNFRSAKKEAHRLLGLPIPVIDAYADGGYGTIITKKKSGFIPENFLVNFEGERKIYFNRYKQLLNQALPSLTFPQQKVIANKYQIGYIAQSDRLSMPIRDKDGNCLTLWKYNRQPAPYKNKEGVEVVPGKVLFSKGRARCPFNLQDLKKYQEDKNGWVFLCGGEKDVLNMVGHGYRAITLGSESTAIDTNYLPLFEGMKIVIAYDYDKAGLEGTVKMRTQLKGVAAEVKVWDWELLALQEGIELFKGFDLTDWLSLKHKV